MFSTHIWIKKWEICILVGLAAFMLLGLWLEREQNDLSNGVLRLHVLANSDSEADQALKLKVRDRILYEAEQILPEQATLSDAKTTLEANLVRLAGAGAEVVAEAGCDYPVTAEITRTWFPTKKYEDFSLPSGLYQSLRIKIGDGSGQNWWCVVFPPLCLGAVSETTQETALDAGLSERQVALLTGESEGYVVKFKALELWDLFKQAIG